MPFLFLHNLSSLPHNDLVLTSNGVVSLNHHVYGTAKIVNPNKTPTFISNPHRLHLFLTTILHFFHRGVRYLFSSITSIEKSEVLEKHKRIFFSKLTLLPENPTDIPQDYHREHLQI